MSANENLIERGCSDDWQVVREAAGDVTTDEFSEICVEFVALRKQAALDRQSREASQTEFARLNRELNEARETERNIAGRCADVYNSLEEERSRVGVLLDEIASTAIAAGMMDPARRGSLDGPNAIQFLRQIKAEYEARRD